MRILADENLPRAIVLWLRGEGHNVLYAAKSCPGVSDSDLLTESETQGHIVLTEDKDFGDLVYRDRRNSHGVILIRMENLPVSARLTRRQAVWTVVESNLPGNFVVVSETKMRVRSLTFP